MLRDFLISRGVTVPDDEVAVACARLGCSEMLNLEAGFLKVFAARRLGKCQWIGRQIARRVIESQAGRKGGSR